MAVQPWLSPNGPYFACKIVAFGREPSGFSEFRLSKTEELALHRYKVKAIGRKPKRLNKSQPRSVGEGGANIESVPR